MRRRCFHGPRSIPAKRLVCCADQLSPPPKPEISPKAKPSDARAVRFSEPRRGYAWSWQRLSDLAYLANNSVTI